MTASGNPPVSSASGYRYGGTTTHSKAGLHAVAAELAATAGQPHPLTVVAARAAEP